MCCLPLRSWYEYLKLLSVQPSVNHARAESMKYSKWMRLDSVYDGDTIIVLIVDEGFVVKRRCRCVGYDSPEMRNAETKEAAIAAREYLKELLPTGLFRGSVEGLDKYGRLLFQHHKNGKSLAQLMVEAGHAYYYDGGTKRPS